MTRISVKMVKPISQYILVSFDQVSESWVESCCAARTSGKKAKISAAAFLIMLQSSVAKIADFSVRAIELRFAQAFFHRKVLSQP